MQLRSTCECCFNTPCAIVGVADARRSRMSIQRCLLSEQLRSNRYRSNKGNQLQDSGPVFDAYMGDQIQLLPG